MARKKQKLNTKKNRNKSTRGRKPYNFIKDLEEVYIFINKIQTQRKITYLCFVDPDLCPVTENLLNDAGLEFECKDSNRHIYKVLPTYHEPTLEDVTVEMIDDEIIEEGQLF